MPPLRVEQMVLPVVACLVLAVLAVRIPRYRFAMMGFVAVVGYAILQDQVSVRLCPEYFTRLHRPVPGVTDPTLLGVCWGFLGAWWGGVLVGYIAGLCATIGPRPQLAPRELVKPLLVYVLGIAAVTAISGFSVWRHADMLGVGLFSDSAEVVPAKRHRELLTVACYHFVAYASSVVGGVALGAWVWAERRTREPQKEPECPPNSSG